MILQCRTIALQISCLVDPFKVRHTGSVPSPKLVRQELQHSRAQCACCPGSIGLPCLQWLLLVYMSGLWLLGARCRARDRTRAPSKAMQRPFSTLQVGAGCCNMLGLVGRMLCLVRIVLGHVSAAAAAGSAA